MSLSGLPILVPRMAGSAHLLSSTGSCERRCPGSNLSSRDFVCRTECHSTSERGSRGEDETAVPCSTDPWSQPPNRTSLSTSFKIHSRVYRIYHKFADNVNSHPTPLKATHSPYPIGRGIKTSHPTYSRFRLEQFADNVNSHPTPLGHGDPHTDPKYQKGRGKIPRSQRSASRVINHRMISRSRQA